MRISVLCRTPLRPQWERRWPKKNAVIILDPLQWKSRTRKTQWLLNRCSGVSVPREITIANNTKISVAKGSPMKQRAVGERNR
jgi:hypothetical protein